MRIARGVQGVRRVESYFLPRQPSAVSDFALLTKVKAKVVGDPNLRLCQFDLTTIAGHVVLTGVVDRREKIDQAVRHAREVDGVEAVK
jgi:osmotically-inducible protein OsmY